VKLAQADFEALAMEQMDMLYRLARRLTRSADQASDLVQETLMRALRARQRFDLHEHGIRPWLVRIMRNLYLSRSGRESRQPRSVENETLESYAPSDNGGPLSPDQLENMDEELVQALHALPEEYQLVLTLWAVEEFSYKEIAAAIEAPIGTVMSRLHRARQQLAKSLHGFGVERGIIRE
jgi:RNA polymerase sigma-70 factor (ECF subfamily)